MSQTSDLHHTPELSVRNHEKPCGELKPFDQIDEIKKEPGLCDESQPSTSSGDLSQQFQDYDTYESLRMRYDDLQEINCQLTEFNQNLAGQLEIWEANDPTTGVGVKELFGNKDLRGVNLKFFMKMEEWKNRCLAAEERCERLTWELNALSKNNPEALNKFKKEATDSESMMFFQQMEQWKNKCILSEKEKDVLTSKLLRAKDRLRALNGGVDPVLRTRKVDDGSNPIYLDNDVEVWKNYTYQLRKDLEKEQREHKKTKETMIELRGYGYREDYVQDQRNQESFEPSLKFRKLEKTEDYSLSEPKLENL